MRAKVDHRFKAGSHQTNTGYRWTSGIVCGGCGAEQTIISSKNSPLPDVMLARKFSQMGWWVGARRVDDACPKCIQANRERRAIKVADACNNRVAAAPAREATREDKRRIRGALDDHYDDRRQMYVDHWTDQKLADKLSVPRAWVANIREEFYGPAQTEEAVKLLGPINELESKATRLESDALSVAERAEKLKAEIAAMRTQVERLNRSA